MSSPSQPGRLRWLVPIVGVCLLLGCLPLGRTCPRQALLSYLYAFVFFTGLSLGSLALVLVHVLTGGDWGERLRPQLLAAARTLPLQAVLALPILIGLRALYPWADAGARLRDTLLRAQGWYLDPAFFVARTVVCFALWLALLGALRRLLANPARSAMLPRLAAAGLIVYALSTLLAVTDWTMSLMPHWHSSIFGLMVATGWLLAGTALAVLRAASARDATAVHQPGLLRDFGNLLLMFVLAWSYLAFMEYLTIWIADQPAETSWYIPRTLTSWRALAWFLIAFHFAVPFAVLLSRRAKLRRQWLAAIAVMLLVANLADALWLIVPDFREQGFDLRWTDLLAAAGMGVLWFSLYFARLGTHGSHAPLRVSRQTLEAAHG
jgi:hypothetical protein